MINILNRTLVFGLILTLCSCGAMQKQIKHGKLEVETKMSDTIFLDPVEDNQKKIIIQIRNTSDKKDLNIKEEIKQALIDGGYKIVTNAKDAQFMLQANILQVGKNTLEDPFSMMGGGFGSSLSGALAGGAIGGAMSDSYKGAVVGGLLGGIASTIIDSAVEVVRYSMITDLQISEKADGATAIEASNARLKQGTSGVKTSTWTQKTNWKKYQTRIVSVAKKTNLKFELAIPELKAGLIQSIAGMF